MNRETQNGEKMRDYEYDDYELLPPITERTPETKTEAAKAWAAFEAAVEQIYNETH